jgi:hypothetical protein
MASSTPDWRTFGGIKRYEKNSITSFNSLIVDKLTLRDAYDGVFTINGELFIYGNTHLKNSVEVGEDALILRDMDVSRNVGVRGNIVVGENISVSKNVDVSGNIGVSGNLTVEGTLTLADDVRIGKDLYVNSDFYLGDNAQPNNRVFFSTNGKKLGLNVYNPTATLDISSDAVNILKMKTSAAQNVNIITTDCSNHGITVSTDGTKNAIKFWNNTPIPFLAGVDGSLDNTTVLNGSTEDATITYYQGGNLTVRCPNNTLVKE